VAWGGPHPGRGPDPVIEPERLAGRDGGWLDGWDAGLRQPGAGDRPARLAGSTQRRLRAGRDVVRPADGPAAGRSGRRGGGAAPGPEGSHSATAIARPDDPPAAGGGLPQGARDAAGGPLWLRAGGWPE